ncbi:hypothetical protein D9619_001025 [Psilocybe cf. subviscida]|uniref:Uncharacterized protein n=1 Tax=Psilocybe cf. subviscida TaxID=2480587 RepID=A0A8H5F323_9AGAR|nr:hypothetical protein D9619_001025 [Psilocybe cf. subviscida]
MSLGASPLTAYFPPAPSSAKRKEHPAAPTRKSKTPRNDDPPAESSGSQKGKTTKKQRLELKQHRLPFTPQAALDPSTPNVGNRREYTALQTPPASVDVGGRTKSKPSTKPVRSVSPLKNNLTTESTSYLPTPSTRPRPRTRATVSSLPLAAETPCKSATSDPSSSKRPSLLTRNTPPAVLLPGSSIIIPSSQSQPELMEVPPDRNHPWSLTEYPQELEEESSNPARIVEHSHEYEAGMIVASSQSQFLVLSPRKKRRDGIPLVISTRQTEIDDIIPSSQSYEKELQIPKLMKNPLPVENSTPHQSRSSAWAFDRNNAPTRTLSDEMFSVPISSSSILDKIFEDEDHRDEHVASDPPGAPPSVHGEDDQGSATETDSDEDWPYVRPMPVPIQNQSPHPVNQEGGEEVPNDFTEAPASQLQSQGSITEYAADCSQNGDDSPSSSLPSVLQEFRDMFGDGDESYPPDFPMSLRT